MKYLVLSILILLLQSSSALAQGPIYLPILMREELLMGNSYGLVVPVVDDDGAPLDVTNYVLNPSAEAAGNFTTVGSSTVTRSTTYQKYGLYSYRVQTTGIGDGLQVTLSSLTNTVHFATARIRNPGTRLRFIIGSTSKEPKLIEKIDDYWSLYGIGFSAAQASGQTLLKITQNGLGVKDFYVDGVQVEPLGYWTSYIDGSQSGCAWTSIPHASTSTRSGQSKAGGKVADFYNDYGFFLKKIVGGGDAALSVNVDEYALLPGGEFNSEKVHPRLFTLVGTFVADTESQLHEHRQALRLALSSDSYPGNQPTPIRYNGAKVQKEILARYQAGLEGESGIFYDGDYEPLESEWKKHFKYTEDAAIQLVADDPYWYEVGESAALLDTSDSATFNIFAARFRSTGQWSNLGNPAMLDNTAVYAIAEDPTYLYFGGIFTEVDGDGSSNYIVRYNKQTGVYSPLGAGGGTGWIQSLVINPAGILYAAGPSNNIGGVAAADGIASWDGSTWSDLGAPGDVTVYTLAIGLDGTLYAAGPFTNLDAIANADGIAAWNGSAWSALGTGMTSGTDIQTIAIHPITGDVYVGGDFAAMGGVTANNIAYWDGSTWNAFSTEPGDVVRSLVFSPTGILYAGGDFTTVGNYVASWNGTAWSGLGSGLNGAARAMALGQDGVLYVGGDFSTAGGINIGEGVARWNGSAWSRLDIELPSSPSTLGILASKYVDPVVSQKYTIALGFQSSGAGTFAGSVNVTNEGSAPAYPDIHITRSGGTTARLQTIKNERNGLELLFDYSLLDGEELVISLYPRNRQVVSSFFVNGRLDAILPNSNFGTWHLANKTNQVTSFVSTSGSPTVTAWMIWRDAYKGYD